MITPLWFIQDFQSNGKGQRGNQWESENGQNLLCSYALPLKRSGNTIVSGVFTAALALLEVLKNIDISDVEIKWPNDLYYKDRKIGGILTENIFSGSELVKQVVGIGLNLNQTNFRSENACSLKMMTGKTYFPKDLIKPLLDQVVHINSYADKNIIELINKNLYKKNQLVTFQTENGYKEYTVKEVNSNGSLVVESEEQESLELEHHRVKWKQ